MYRVNFLKKELLLDINLNKDLVRNYELAARRLEAVFMTQIDHEKLKDFDKFLKEEVKEFLSTTTTGRKLQDLDHRLSLFVTDIT